MYFPVSSQQIRDFGGETSSLPTARTAIQSAIAETFRFHLKTDREVHAIPRVLADGLSRIRTGDGGFGDSKAQHPTLFSVAKLGGSDSLLVRPSEGPDSEDQYCNFEFKQLRVGRV